MADKRFLVTLICFIGLCVAYPPFREYIPNSLRVPDPCYTRMIGRKTQLRYVQAVGHYGVSSDRNPFGRDFKRTRGNWTILCRMDSDKDGVYNGYELGDTHCRWNKNDPRTRRYLRVPYSHPGIAETFSNKTRRYEVVPQLRMAICSRNFPLIS
ncbi:Temptin [Mizuhopecten yessoensis]|uniref:Temptin n=1 Tax=Mizuhopecten yessoensis TaxID=6573 RepID=A0A210PMX0_MIZYE|nr:Temptin [Mizuhopecten yessoensis]